MKMKMERRRSSRRRRKRTMRRRRKMMIRQIQILRRRSKPVQHKSNLV